MEPRTGQLHGRVFYGGEKSVEAEQNVCFALLYFWDSYFANLTKRNVECAVCDTL